MYLNIITFSENTSYTTNHAIQKILLTLTENV